jgi:hypothetical protein
VELELGPDLYTFMYTLPYIFYIQSIDVCLIISVLPNTFQGFHLYRSTSFKVLEGQEDGWVGRPLAPDFKLVL